MKKAYVDTSRGQMHYRSAGSGTPIILVHVSGSNSQEFEKLGDILADQYAVYAIDLFGCGYSDPPFAKLTMTEHAHSVIEFMNVMGIEKAYLYGGLVGANVCARAAAAWPERVNAVMFAECVYFPDYAEFRSKREVFSDVPFAEDGSHLLTYWARTSQFEYPFETKMWRVVAQANAGKFSECMHQACFEDVDYKYIFSQIKVPAFVLALEKYAMAPMMRPVAEMIPNGTLVSVDENVYISKANPELAASLIRQYMPA